MQDHLRSLDPSTPVLIGVGASTVPAAGPSGAAPAGGAAPLEPVDVMVDAAVVALADAVGAARSGELAARIGTVAVPEGNWSYPDPARLVADRIGAVNAATIRVDIGVPQHTPIRVALERIRSGELEAAMVVGGEAKATQLQITRGGGVPHETAQPGVAPDERWQPQGELMAQAEIDAGIWAPVEQYACIENALRAAEGITRSQHLDEIASLWERFNVVARSNPFAVFGEPRSAEFLRSAGPGNRPLASPYAKWHSTQWALDQGAAMVLSSVRVATELGVPEERWIFPRVAVESSWSASLTKRAELHRWPAMGVLGRAAEAHLGTTLREIDLVEVYSCFPAAVRVQQRELGLDPDGTPTVTGGMAFAGGPFNNYTYQATAEIVARLRQEQSVLGMVTTVSGLLTKPALTVWSTEPGAEPALLADLGEAAAEATAVVDVVGEHTGTGRVVSYTVTYDGESPRSAFVIADVGPDVRWIGTSTDPELLAAALDEHAEFVGASVQLGGTTATLG